MKETTRQLLACAADAIEAADILLTNDKADFAAGRAYYYNAKLQSWQGLSANFREFR